MKMVLWVHGCTYSNISISISISVSMLMSMEIQIHVFYVVSGVSTCFQTYNHYYNLYLF